MPFALLPADPTDHNVRHMRDMLDRGDLRQTAHRVRQVRGWTDTTLARYLGLEDSTEEEADMDTRLTASGEALATFLEGSDDLDKEQLTKLTDDWERHATTRHAVAAKRTARLAEVEAEVVARIGRGESLIPTPEAVADLLADLGIDPDAEPEVESRLGYHAQGVRTAVQGIEAQRAVEAQIAALKSPEGIAKQEALAKGVAGAWKSFRTAGEGSSEHAFTTYLAKHHPELDVVHRRGSGVEWDVLASNARDQKSPRPRKGISSAFGSGGPMESFIRTERLAEVLSAHQAPWTPSEMARGGSSTSRSQALSVSPEVYVHGGKTYQKVEFADMSRFTPANAVHELQVEVARYRAEQAKAQGDAS